MFRKSRCRRAGCMACGSLHKRAACQQAEALSQQKSHSQLSGNKLRGPHESRAVEGFGRSRWHSSVSQAGPGGEGTKSDGVVGEGEWQCTAASSPGALVLQVPDSCLIDCSRACPCRVSATASRLHSVRLPLHLKHWAGPLVGLNGSPFSNIPTDPISLASHPTSVPAQPDTAHGV